jgi:hypothetical protein
LGQIIRPRPPQKVRRCFRSVCLLSICLSVCLSVQPLPRDTSSNRSTSHSQAETRQKQRHSSRVSRQRVQRVLCSKTRTRAHTHTGSYPSLGGLRQSRDQRWGAAASLAMTSKRGGRRTAPRTVATHPKLEKPPCEIVR